MNNELQIRNSTSDFLIFTKQHSEDGINVRIEDETIWLTQEGIATLFDKGRTTIVEHIKNIYATGELSQKATCRKFRQVRIEGIWVISPYIAFGGVKHKKVSEKFA